MYKKFRSLLSRSTLSCSDIAIVIKIKPPILLLEPENRVAAKEYNLLDTKKSGTVTESNDESGSIPPSRTTQTSCSSCNTQNGIKIPPLAITF